MVAPQKVFRLNVLYTFGMSASGTFTADGLLIRKNEYNPIILNWPSKVIILSHFLVAFFCYLCRMLHIWSDVMEYGGGKRYNSFVGYYREKYGERLQKIVLDAGFTCPNRDGTVGSGGCTYCDNAAFHPGYSTPGKTLRRQMDEGIEFHNSIVSDTVIPAIIWLISSPIRILMPPSDVCVPCILRHWTTRRWSE